MTDRRRILLAAIPVIGFAGLATVFWRGLSGNPSRLPSNLLGQPVPSFELAAVPGLPQPGVSSPDLAKGKVSLVNIFASWCGPCREEHPILMELAKRTDITLIGINNKDAAADAVRFLNTLGNPYQMVGADSNGRVTIDWGGYGVPETFVVDGKGIIRFKVVGPLTPDFVSATLSSEIEKAKGG